MNWNFLVSLFVEDIEICNYLLSKFIHCFLYLLYFLNTFHIYFLIWKQLLLWKIALCGILVGKAMINGSVHWSIHLLAILMMSSWGILFFVWEIIFVCDHFVILIWSNWWIKEVHLSIFVNRIRKHTGLFFTVINNSGVEVYVRKEQRNNMIENNT